MTTNKTEANLLTSDTSFSTQQPAGVSLGGTLARITDPWGRSCDYVVRARAKDWTRPGLAYCAIDASGALMAADGFRLHVVEGAVDMSQATWSQQMKVILVPPALLKPGVCIYSTDQSDWFAAHHIAYGWAWWQISNGTSFPDRHGVMPQHGTLRAYITDPAMLARRLVRPAGEIKLLDGEQQPTLNPWLPSTQRVPKQLHKDIMLLDIKDDVTQLHHCYRYAEDLPGVAQRTGDGVLQFVVNPRYLAAALAGLAGPVDLEMEKPEGPIVLRCGSISAAVMPMSAAKYNWGERFPSREASNV